MTLRSARAVMLWGVGVVLFGLATTVNAQTNSEVFEDFQWNLSTPGARANGMGRAFIGLADDATAAVANPAGLASLTRPQVYVEYKNTRLRVDRLSGPTSLSTLSTSPFGDTINAVSFLSVAYPIGHGITVSFARHQFLDHEETFDYAPRVEASNNGRTFFAVHATSQFNAASYMGAAAMSLLKDTVRVGVSIAANRLSAESDLVRYNNNYSTNPPTSTGVVNQEIRIPSSSSTSASVTVGGMYRPNDVLSVGAVYIKAPSFTFSEDFLNSNGVQVSGTMPNGTSVTFPADLSLHVPSRFGAGVAVRPTQLGSRLLAVFDVSRINYSDLAKDFVVTNNLSAVLPENFTMDDRTEVHFGGEYNVITGKNPVFVRGGVFTSPDHRVKFVATSASPIASGDCDRTCVIGTYTDQYNLLPQKTRVYGTIGGGVVLGPHLQLDASYVGTKEFVASVAARF
jgi:long-chain fatty acid transport protein